MCINPRIRAPLALLTALCLLLAACGKKSAEGSYRVAIATDLHYLSPALTDHGDLFRQVMEAGDGKVTEYCDEITDAFLEEVRVMKPDALILTGDLSFNGERDSHLALAEKLASLETDGVPVFVLPGNHDLFRSPYSFFDAGAESVPGVTAEEFREIYAAFGFDEAVASDSDSLSYVAQLNGSTRLLMLDANTPHDFCSLSAETLRWIDAQLGEAEQAGHTVLVACHQNLFQHSMFISGYVLETAEQLYELLAAHRVPLILSGHMHIQHIRSVEGVTEIAGSPLTMGDCHYGVLSASNGSLRYETHPVSMSAWAQAHGLENEDLRDFAAYAAQSFERRTRLQAEEQLAVRGFSPEEIEPLADFACALNNAYFSGDLSGIPALDPDGALLQRWVDSGTFFGYYFASIESEIGKDHTRWEN
ncbi:MAG: metallophosphoesterase [Oscillospiraceae bacterium]|nr:metallophosphoesterase [Oscillospiraceae bacterium]